MDLNNEAIDNIVALMSESKCAEAINAIIDGFTSKELSNIDYVIDNLRPNGDVVELYGLYDYVVFGIKINDDYIGDDDVYVHAFDEDILTQIYRLYDESSGWKDTCQILGIVLGNYGVHRTVGQDPYVNLNCARKFKLKPGGGIVYLREDGLIDVKNVGGFIMDLGGVLVNGIDTSELYEHPEAAEVLRKFREIILSGVMSKRKDDFNSYIIVKFNCMGIHVANEDVANEAQWQDRRGDNGDWQQVLEDRSANDMIYAGREEISEFVRALTDSELNASIGSVSAREKEFNITVGGEIKHVLFVKY